MPGYENRDAGKNNSIATGTSTAMLGKNTAVPSTNTKTNLRQKSHPIGYSLE